MNIFFLHTNPAKSARYYFNRHCVKIILEIAQMLYTAHWIIYGADHDWSDHLLDLKPYRKTHFNHPTAKWVRKSKANYMYACHMGLELCYEYTRRYRKIHKCQVRLEWLLTHPPSSFTDEPIQGYIATKNIPDNCTPIPLAMPEAYHTDDAIQSYRLYYIHDKRSIATATESWEQLSAEWNIST